ncbi:MAG: helix-turn-helix transcriptional regulator [Nitrospirae bacterium]|nr:helix-turn-helix transcriptional regulator [Nitrospirota bacterium]
MIDGDLQTARVHFFKALGDRTRLDILKMLREGRSLSVTEIYQKLGHAQNLISHHLACLKNCGLVTAEKQGKQVFYRLRNRKILKLLNLSDQHIRDVLESVLFCDVVSDETEATARRTKRRTA